VVLAVGIVEGLKGIGVEMVVVLEEGGGCLTHTHGGGSGGGGGEFWYCTDR